MATFEEDIENTPTQSLIQMHKVLHGSTFNAFVLNLDNPELENKLRPMLIDAIQGNRKPITNKDLKPLGIEFPDSDENVVI